VAVSLFSDSGENKSGPRGEWKKFLSANDYKELVRREIKEVEAVLGKDDFETAQRGKVSALMIAAYTLSAKDVDPKSLEKVRSAALKLAAVIGEQGKTDEARKLAHSIASLEGDSSGKAPPPEFSNYVNSKLALMVMYMPKEKGGSGLHPGLQLTSRLQGSQEFIENLFSYLAKRPLKKEQLDKAAQELQLVSYRTAVSGELISAYVPEKKTKKRDPEVWRKTSAAMIESSLDLAQAAEKRNAKGIQTASSRLIDSCVACHKMFQ
jgi:hypothetical protein